MFGIDELVVRIQKNENGIRRLFGKLLERRDEKAFVLFSNRHHKVRIVLVLVI